jgi:hypothetical protein
MTAASIDVVWCRADGREFPVERRGIGLDVAQGVRIDVAIEPRGAARVSVTLTLTGLRLLPDDTEASVRFVVIPLDDASLMLAVAEPSAEPVQLAPVPSSPTWTTAGGRMPAGDGWMTARRPEGAAIEFRVLPAPEQMSVCALQVRAIPPAGARFSAGRPAAEQGAVRLSVPRLSPQLVALECEWAFHAGSSGPQSWP